MVIEIWRYRHYIWDVRDQNTKTQKFGTVKKNGVHLFWLEWCRWARHLRHHDGHLEEQEKHCSRWCSNGSVRSYFGEFIVRLKQSNKMFASQLVRRFGTSVARASHDHGGRVGGVSYFFINHPFFLETPSKLLHNSSRLNSHPGNCDVFPNSTSLRQSSNLIQFSSKITNYKALFSRLFGFFFLYEFIFPFRDFRTQLRLCTD